MVWFYLLHFKYSFVYYSYLTCLYCIDFFRIFLLDFVKQEFKTRSSKKSEIIETQLNEISKDFYFCA